MKKEIKEILEKLINEGYEAYVVGGFVRDFLLKRVSFDVDICTNALPSDLERIFGIKANNFGGINFYINKYKVTITSFRIDSCYKKGYPQKIEFNVTLKEDLLRRDFTINTILMDIDGNIISFLNGTNDLENKLIKVVGNPDERIKEDPLRIIRALRFATAFDFYLDNDLIDAIKNNKELIENISKEKINEELKRVVDKEKFNNLVGQLDLQSLKIRL